MRWLGLLILLTMSMGARAQGADASERLDAAIRYYLAGNHDQARITLTEILIDPTVQDREIRLRARVFLGEVLYVEGQRDAAWDAFRAILEEAPRLRLDPYEHPPDVINFFETVRAAIALSPPDVTLEPPPLDPEPYPWMLALAPFGAYQFAHAQPVRGSLLAMGQAVTAIISIQKAIAISQAGKAETQDEYDELIRQRTWQLAFGFSFYGLWVLNIAQSTNHWRQGQLSLGLDVIPVSAGDAGYSAFPVEYFGLRLQVAPPRPGDPRR